MYFQAIVKSCIYLFIYYHCYDGDRILCMNFIPVLVSQEQLKINKKNHLLNICVISHRFNITYVENKHSIKSTV